MIGEGSRDYLYIPLGGSKEGKWKSIRNIFIIFLVSGFWHGANWTFIFWGGFHAILFLPSFILNTNRKYTSSIIGEKTFLPSPKEFVQVGITFILVTIGWVFFRSETIVDSFNYLSKMFLEFGIPQNLRKGILFVMCLTLLDFIIKGNERMNFKKSHSLELLGSVILVLVILFFYNQSSSFIYFQF